MTYEQILMEQIVKALNNINSNLQKINNTLGEISDILEVNNEQISNDVL